MRVAAARSVGANGHMFGSSMMLADSSGLVQNKGSLFQTPPKNNALISEWHPITILVGSAALRSAATEAWRQDRSQLRTASPGRRYDSSDTAAGD
jgi:hypothetical protein